MIVVVVIQAVEHSLIAIVESLVGEVELCRDARMELIGILAVANEQHVANQGIQTVAQVVVSLQSRLVSLVGNHSLVLSLESSLYLALSVVFWL